MTNLQSAEEGWQQCNTAPLRQMAEAECESTYVGTLDGDDLDARPCIHDGSGCYSGAAIKCAAGDAAAASEDASPPPPSPPPPADPICRLVPQMVDLPPGVWCNGDPARREDKATCENHFFTGTNGHVYPCTYLADQGRCGLSKQSVMCCDHLCGGLAVRTEINADNHGGWPFCNADSARRVDKDTCQSAYWTGADKRTYPCVFQPAADGAPSKCRLSRSDACACNVAPPDPDPSGCVGGRDLCPPGCDEFEGMTDISTTADTADDGPYCSSKPSRNSNPAECVSAYRVTSQTDATFTGHWCFHDGSSCVQSPDPFGRCDQFRLPAEGVAVLDGGDSSARGLYCLYPGDEGRTEIPPNHNGWSNRLPIAPQCCTKGGDCRRVVDGACVGGTSTSTYPNLDRPWTFNETAKWCEERDLVVCDKSCAGEGCSYNSHPVYSSLPCDVVPFTFVLTWGPAADYDWGGAPPEGIDIRAPGNRTSSAEVKEMYNLLLTHYQTNSTFDAGPFAITFSIASSSSGSETNASSDDSTETPQTFKQYMEDLHARHVLVSSGDPCDDPYNYDDSNCAPKAPLPPPPPPPSPLPPVPCELLNNCPSSDGSSFPLAVVIGVAGGAVLLVCVAACLLGCYCNRGDGYAADGEACPSARSSTEEGKTPTLASNLQSPMQRTFNFTSSRGSTPEQADKEGSAPRGAIRASLESRIPTSLSSPSKGKRSGGARMGFTEVRASEDATAAAVPI